MDRSDPETGFTAVEEHLRCLGRRLNLVTAQHNLYLTASVIALVLGIWILLAMHASASHFRLGFWGGASIAALGAAAAAIRTYRGWRSLEDVARFADRQGDLSDRLSTLIFAQSRPHPSHLNRILANQVASLSNRWEVHVLAPRRVPRSLFLLLAAMVILAATTFLERQPAAPTRMTVSQVLGGKRPETSGKDLPAAHGRMARSDAPGQQPPSRNAGGEDNAAATGQPGVLDKSGGQADRKTGGAHPNPIAGATGPIAEAEQPGSGGSEPMTEKLQQLIRQAFGAERVLLAASTQQLGQRQASPNHEQAAGSGRPNDAARGHDDDSPARTGGKPPGDRSGPAGNSKQPGQPADGKGGGSARAGGGPGGAGSRDVFGNQAPLSAEKAQLKSFSVKLNRSSRSVTLQMEPQVRPDGGPVRELGGADPLPDEQRISQRDVEDSPLHRPRIPAEHESLVRSIFSARPDR